MTEWAASLSRVSERATYFNFLDSHDGIGVMAVKSILSKEEIEMMSLKVIENGGFISYKNDADGMVTPYELNITDIIVNNGSRLTIQLRSFDKHKKKIIWSNYNFRNFLFL